jgi:hypothetical protein
MPGIVAHDIGDGMNSSFGRVAMVETLQTITGYQNFFLAGVQMRRGVCPHSSALLRCWVPIFDQDLSSFEQQRSLQAIRLFYLVALLFFAEKGFRDGCYPARFATTLPKDVLVHFFAK